MSTTFQHPQTPQSPSQYSPSNTDPSMHMPSSMTSISSTLPTPAHSVNGSSIPGDMVHDAAMSDEPPKKRKRALQDQGEREQKKAHIEDSSYGIESLHLNVGDKYLLCRTHHTLTGPKLDEDLFEQFGLTQLAEDVARVKANGEKNALRKTYKGHLRKLGINGHWDSVPKEARGPDSMHTLMNYPQNEWFVHNVKGKEITDGLHPEVVSRIPKAMFLAKGVLSKSVWNSSVLGDLGPGGVGKVSKEASIRATAPNSPMPPAAVNAPRTKVLASAAQEAAWSKRGIKKRGYNDSNFDGYNEAFGDEDGAPGSGYSTADGELASSGQKRRKKVHTPAAPSPVARSAKGKAARNNKRVESAQRC